MTKLTSYDKAIKEVESLGLGIEKDMYDEALQLKSAGAFRELKSDGISFNAYDLGLLLDMLTVMNEVIEDQKKALVCIRDNCQDHDLIFEKAVNALEHT